MCFLVKLIFYINTNKIHQVKKIINAADLSRVIKSRLTKVFDSYNQNQSVTIEDKRVVLDVIKSDEFANQFLRESYDIGFTQLLFSLARSHLLPDDDNVNYELASFYQYAGNNDKAIFYYFKIPNNSELYLPSLNALATLLLELKNDQIRKEAIHVIKDKCDPVTCDLIDSIMAYNADNFTLAADTFERVLSDNRHFDSACYHTPRADDSHNMRTQISLLMLMYHAYYKSGRYDDFKKTILCVIQQHKIPDGRIMNVLKSIDNAFVSSGPQIANKKSLVDHINYLGYSMILEDDDINLALSLLKLAGEFSPDDPYLLDSIAWGYYKMGDYVHANSTIARALTLMPGEPEVLIHAGEIWNAMGWYKLAAGAWDKALQIGLEILDEKRMNELREKIKQLEKN